MNLKEIKNTLKYLINQNTNLELNNKKTTTIELIGDSGIGKTAIIEQIANELNKTFIKLNLAQLEELGDLCGFPIKEYEMCNPEGNCEWIPSDLIKYYIESGYKSNNSSRMGYALPKWVPREETENGIILLLDDFNRADIRFIQATMELIDKGEFYSWHLPKNTTIILSSNPDNGDYQVSSLDNAQRTRFISFNVDFNLEIWAEWAEEEGIDSRVINFALLYPEIFEKENDIQKINARSFVTFANSISGIEDFSLIESLKLILNIASGCFSSEENIIGTAFTTFINNKLDKLINPNDLLNLSWENLSNKLNEIVYKQGIYQPHLASILTTRFVNYVRLMLKNKKIKSEIIINRILDFVNSDKVYLSEDLLYYLIKTIYSEYPGRFQKLFLNPKIIEKLKC